MSDFEQKLLQGFVDRPPRTPEEVAEEAAALVRIVESAENYRQLSKALCGKENATLEELLQGASQVKSELAAVKRERDAVIGLTDACSICKNNKPENEYGLCHRCKWGYGTSVDFWEFNGIFPDTEVQ